jgi:Prokaryotic phospholipase A2
MRLRTAVLVAVTSVLTVVSPALAGSPRGHSAVADWAYVRHELYDVPLRQFIADAASADRWFDWSTDGCSAPLLGDTGRSYNFREACRRHDFGYRNLHLLEYRYGLGRDFWNSTNRRRVDQQFLADMKSHCRGRALLLQPSCFGMAHGYYTAVRVAGGP